MKAGIVGGGILGKLSAWVMAQHGWSVTLFDSHSYPNCSEAAAGLLSPIAELDKCDVIIAELGLIALQQHWPILLSQLGVEIYFQQRGSIYVSHARDRAELLRTVNRIAKKLQNPQLCRPLTQHTLTTLEPELSTFSAGFYFPDEGQLDNQQLLLVLSERLQDCEVQILENQWVSEIVPGKIVTDKCYKFDCVVDCRGLGAKSQFADLRSVRGELIWLSAPGVHLTRPIRVSHPRYQLYVAPRPNQIYLLGASEIESEDLSPISVQTTLELLTAIYFLNPKFSEARILKTVTHCRPTLADHLPRIRYCDGWLAVNGLYRHGFLIAPSIVMDLMTWLEHGIQQVKYPQLWEQAG